MKVPVGYGDLVPDSRHLVVGLQMDVESGAPREDLVCQGVVAHIVVVVIANTITVNLGVTPVWNKNFVSNLGLGMLS